MQSCIAQRRSYTKIGGARSMPRVSLELGMLIFDGFDAFFSQKISLCSDGTIYIDTPFSRLLGKPPIMVAGMTPSTGKGWFCLCRSLRRLPCRTCGRWTLLRSRTSLQSCGDSVYDTCWSWYYPQFIIHQSSPVWVPVPSLARDAQGRVTY